MHFRTEHRGQGCSYKENNRKTTGKERKEIERYVLRMLTSIENGQQKIRRRGAWRKVLLCRRELKSEMRIGKESFLEVTDTGFVDWTKERLTVY